LKSALKSWRGWIKRSDAVAYSENLLRTLRRRVSRSELAVAFLGLPVSKDPNNSPGLVMIQIDGLSRKQMEQAMKAGRLPFLRRLIARENYETRTFYSGLPSSTPAVQAELFYGVRGAVPAFSFLNRDAKRVFSMFDPESARKVEEDISLQGEGLLRGGSSWCNIYTGGAAADESHFCASRLGLGDVLRSRSIIKTLTFPILHFASLMRLIGFTFAEFSVAMSDLFKGVSRGESLRMEARTLVSRLVVCIVLREVLTIGAKIDVARGLPVVHLNFLGYDEQSHRRGPSSAFAHWSLKGIDRAIKQIYRAAQRSARRDYQVWIYSDHGQEKTRLFSHEGKELDEIIRNELDGFDSSAQPVTRRPLYHHRSAYILRKSGDRIKEGYQKEKAGFEEAQWFSVAAMGPIGHLYLIHPQAMAQKMKLAERLVRNGKVPGAIVRNDSMKCEWFCSDGQRLILASGAIPMLPHPDGIKKQVMNDLVDLCHQDCAGDIVLLGWSPDKPPVSFVDEHGSHAGPGPEETQGFVLLPPVTALPAQAGDFVRPADLRAAALHFLGRQLIQLNPKRKPSQPQHIRVMTYNVHGCRGMDGRVSPGRIARIIEQYHPDVVALQELDFGRLRSERHDQPDLIAKALGMKVEFCPTVIDQDEQYGHALLTHVPLKIIRTALFGGDSGQRHREPRGALWVTVELKGLTINLLNTHFGLGRRERIAQADELLGEDWIGGKSSHEPFILCGDFNMMPGSRPYRAITRHLHDVQNGFSEFKTLNTFSTFHPFARIDHVFISHDLDAERVAVPRTDLTRVASDHLPLIVDLTL
jgi:endonuclease/exonuclease/phosphatase family metal-dependent hydrolase